MEEIIKPDTMPQDKWDGLSLYKKLFWMREVEKYGDYDAVVEEMSKRGSGHKNTKISDEEVKEIRQSNATNRELAEKYGVHWTSISRIRNNRSR